MVFRKKNFQAIFKANNFEEESKFRFFFDFLKKPDGGQKDEKCP